MFNGCWFEIQSVNESTKNWSKFEPKKLAGCYRKLRVELQQSENLSVNLCFMSFEHFCAFEHNWKLKAVEISSPIETISNAATEVEQKRENLIARTEQETLDCKVGSSVIFFHKTRYKLRLHVKTSSPFAEEHWILTTYQHQKLIKTLEVEFHLFNEHYFRYFQWMFSNCIGECSLHNSFVFERDLSFQGI